MNWSEISSTVQAVITALATTGVLGVIGGVITRHFTNRKTTDKIVSGITEKIIAKDIRVDLKRLTKRELKAIASEMFAKQEQMEETIKLQSQLLKSMAVVVAKFKLATEEEKQAIVDAINNLKEPSEETAEVEDSSVIVSIDQVEEIKEENDSDLF